MLQPGQTVSVLIEKPAAGGRMIARVNGQVVLVAGAIPGERVLAQVDRVGKGVAYAKTLVAEEPSADRVVVASDSQCGGCSYAHIDYERQREIKSLIIADAFARIAGVPLPAPVTVARSPIEGTACALASIGAAGTSGSFAKGRTSSATHARRGNCYRPHAT
jgi:23S rRNA (uracil1939-C5)-methyltransferase